MDGDGVDKGIIVTILIIPLLTVANIILAAAGCITTFFLIRGLFRILGGVGGKVKEKAAKFGKDVKQEVNRLEAEKVSP